MIKNYKKLIQICIDTRGVYSDHQVDFALDVSSRFKIGSFVRIDFYIIVNPIFKSGQIGFSYKDG